MKKLNLTEQKGIAQIFLLVGMLLIAISLPLATKLVQQNQENRSNAATKTTCFCYVGSSQGVKVTGGSTSSLSSCKSKCTAGACKCTTTTTATTVTSPAKVTCSYTYSPWSPSTCPSSGKQTRNVTGKSPDGCSGGSSVTSRTCTYVAKTDTSKSNGSTCASNSECSSGFCNSLTKKCESKPESNGSACSLNSNCASGYCNLTTKKCAAKVIKDCVCGTTPGSCSLGDLTWKDNNASSGSYTWTCSGSYCKSRDCSIKKTINTTTSIWYYFNGTSCVGKAYANSDDCSKANKACYSTYAVCDKNNTPSSSTKTIYYYYQQGVGCVVVSSTPTVSAPTACQSIACYSSKASCETAHTAKTTTYFYYSDSVSSCIGISYASLAECNKVLGKCYTTKSACDVGKTTYFYYSGSVSSCIGISYASLAECNKVLGKCYTSKSDCDSAGTNLCGPGASPNRDHYPMPGSYCVTGAVYTMVDNTGKDGEYNWTCAKNGVTQNCVSSKKKSGGGGGGGSDSGDYYVPGSLSLNPSSLTLKVGQTATVVASESVTWSSDKAAVATVTANGVITGVTVGTATVTATSTSGETATVEVKVISSDAQTLSFKIAFAGIKPVYINSSGASYNCLADMEVAVEILNRPTNIYEEFTGVKAPVDGNEVDSKGNQVFQVYNLEIGSSLAAVDTFNYVKVKGPFHLKRRMCKDGQSGKLDETTTCDINLGKTDGVPYDFSEYTLLAGDVDSNGVINSVDFSLVKNAVNADAEPECGREYDLNMDGVVNSLDLNLVKDSLSSIDDE